MTMAQSFREWRLENSGSCADYEDYLHELAEAARKANEGTAPRTIEGILSRSLEYHLDGTSPVENTVASVLAGLAEAGYAIVRASAQFSRDDVSAALNEAANVLSDHETETTDTIAVDDAVNLLVNFTMHLLDHPGDGIEDAIIAQYADVELDDSDLAAGEEMPGKGSDRWNELLVQRVLGWIS